MFLLGDYHRAPMFLMSHDMLECSLFTGILNSGVWYFRAFQVVWVVSIRLHKVVFDEIC